MSSATSPQGLVPPAGSKYGATGSSPRASSSSGKSSAKNGRRKSIAIDFTLSSSSSSSASPSDTSSPDGSIVSRNNSLSGDSDASGSSLGDRWSRSRFPSRGSFASNPPEAQFSRESLSGCSGLDLTLDIDAGEEYKNEKSPMLPHRIRSHFASNSPRFSNSSASHGFWGNALVRSVIGSIMGCLTVLLVLSMTHQTRRNETLIVEKPFASANPYYRAAELLIARPSSSFEPADQHHLPHQSYENLVIDAQANGRMPFGEPRYLNMKPHPPAREADAAYGEAHFHPLDFTSTRIQDHHKMKAEKRDEQLAFITPPPASKNVDYGVFSELKMLNYPEPQNSLRLQLREGWRYVTSLSNGGHSRQILSDIKLLYYAKLARRAAILPTLTPAYIDRGRPESISAFYDLTRFMNESDMLALTMSQAKLSYSSGAEVVTERLGCWSIEEAAVGLASAAPSQEALEVHSIEVTRWALPTLMRGFGGVGIAFPALRLFDINSEVKAEWLEKVRRLALPQRATAKKDASIPLSQVERRYANHKDGFDPRAEGDAKPDEQLMCIDNPIYLAPVTPRAIEDHQGISEPLPYEDQSWISIGQHLHFTPEVDYMADEYLMRTFGVEQAEEIPAFIAVHVRRGDLHSKAGPGRTVDEYEAALHRLQSRMHSDNLHGLALAEHNLKSIAPHTDISKLEVVVTSDDPEFAHALREIGWRVIDHRAMRTAQSLGAWWPTILDSAILARGSGLVGTGKSAFSELAALRVKYWNGGLVETV